MLQFKSMKLALVAVALLLLSSCDGYNILCVFTIPTKSHNTLGGAIVRTLLKAGHQVTWATPYPDGTKPTKNLTIIDVSAVQSFFEDMQLNDSRIQDIVELRLISERVTEVTFQNPELRRAMIHEQFDAVVSEWLLTDTHAGIAAALQVPWILLSTVPMHPYMEYLVDEVRSVPMLPVMSPYPIPMNFFQRLTNSFIIVAIQYGIWLYTESTTEFYKSVFEPFALARGVTLPPFFDALHNVSILLVNSHPSYSPAQSLPPNVIEIGGFHIEENIPPLSKDLQDILDSSPQGVVYFSLGTVVNSSVLPEQTKNDLVQVLGELPYTVLWKFEEQLGGLPKNVYVRSWMPQSSILSHPNVKLFITHGGLLSTLEALHFGVPLLAIPLFGDQPFNAERAARDGYAVQVSYSEDMGEELRVALKEILGNDSYREKAKYLSKLFHNRPLSPSKLITHYVELAIESKGVTYNWVKRLDSGWIKFVFFGYGFCQQLELACPKTISSLIGACSGRIYGAPHLRSKAPLYPWYQRWMLDQLIFLLAVFYVLYRMVRKLVGLLVSAILRLYIKVGRNNLRNTTKKKDNRHKVKNS